MGFSSFYGNQFAQRLLLVITDPRKRPPYTYLKIVQYSKIIGFTAIQFVLAGGIYAVTKTLGKPFCPLFILFEINYLK
jgi:hypothetical protein